VKPGGHTLTISYPAGQGREAERKAESDFQRRIKQFTSSTKPYHCLVESIEIETPSALLGEGVTLIDRPGLDDTERFRVQLTERAIQDVDAVLFLTKSGPRMANPKKISCYRFCVKEPSSSSSLSSRKSAKRMSNM
jgi:hypothetical protein